MFRSSRQKLSRAIIGKLLGNRDFYDAVVEFLHKQGVEAFLATDRLGYPLLLHTRDRTITRAIIREGEWQRAIFENFEKFIADHESAKACFIDVGANIGSHSVYALHSKIFDEVIAVEANPELGAILQHNFEINDTGKRYRVFNVGAHRERGTLQFAHNHRNIAAGSFRAVEGGDAATVIEVAPLADLLADHGLASSHQALALWVDVEGHEADVLKGARPLFEKFNVSLCMEITPGRLSSEEAAFLELLLGRASGLCNALDLSPVSAQSVLEGSEQIDILAYFPAH